MCIGIGRTIDQNPLAGSVGCIPYHHISLAEAAKACSALMLETCNDLVQDCSGSSARSCMFLAFFAMFLEDLINPINLNVGS